MRFPEWRAIAEEGVHPDGVGVVEVDEDAFAVAGGRGGGHTGFFIPFDVETVFVEGCFPVLFAGVSVEAEDSLEHAVMVGDCEEDIGANDGE